MLGGAEMRNVTGAAPAATFEANFALMWNGSLSDHAPGLNVDGADPLLTSLPLVS